MSSVVYHDDLNEARKIPALAALRPIGGAAPAPFDRLEWLALLGAECLADRAPRLAVAADGTAHAALALIDAGPGRLAALANWYSFAFRPLGDPALFAPLARDLRRHATRVTLAPLPADAVPPLRAAFAGTGWQVRAAPCDRNHFLTRDGRDFAAYWAGRPGRLRETVRRKAGKGAIALRIARAFDPADWAAYEAVYAASWKPAEGSPRFLRRFAEAEGAAGRLRLGIATHAGAPVAAQLWTIEGGTAFIHKLAHDDRARAHSPGTLLSAALFEQAFEVDRVDTIDFGTGDDAYKADWMEQCRLRWRLEAFDPRAPREWPALARGIARAALRRDRLVSPDRAA